MRKWRYQSLLVLAAACMLAGSGRTLGGVRAFAGERSDEDGGGFGDDYEEDFDGDSDWDDVGDGDSGWDDVGDGDPDWDDGGDGDPDWDVGDGDPDWDGGDVDSDWDDGDLDDSKLEWKLDADGTLTVSGSCSLYLDVEYWEE